MRSVVSVQIPVSTMLRNTRATAGSVLIQNMLFQLILLRETGVVTHWGMLLLLVT